MQIDGNLRNQHMIAIQQGSKGHTPWYQAESCLRSPAKLQNTVSGTNFWLNNFAPRQTQTVDDPAGDEFVTMRLVFELLFALLPFSGSEEDVRFTLLPFPGSEEEVGLTLSGSEPTSDSLLDPVSHNLHCSFHATAVKEPLVRRSAS